MSSVPICGTFPCSKMEDVSQKENPDGETLVPLLLQVEAMKMLCY